MTATPKITKPTGRERLALLLITVVALGMLALAVPRGLVGGLLALAPGVHENLSLPQPAELPLTITMLSAAQDLFPTPEVGAFLTLGQSLLGDPATRESLEAVVRISPIRPRQWLQLAELSLAAPPQKALAAWRTSVFASRIYPLIMADRVAVGLRLKEMMSPADLAILEEQVRFAFVIQPAKLHAVMQRPELAPHLAYYQSCIAALSEAEIAALVRIFALH